MKFGDKVKVLSCPVRPDHEGKPGTVVNYPNDTPDAVVRVRLQDPGESRWVEIDGTADKFQLIPPQTEARCDVCGEPLTSKTWRVCGDCWASALRRGANFNSLRK